jgi:hypothetical protein
MPILTSPGLRLLSFHLPEAREASYSPLPVGRPKRHTRSTQDPNFIYALFRNAGVYMTKCLL